MTIRVQKGSSGKLIVQDWSVLETYDDEGFVIRLLTRRQIAALLSITEFLHWETRYKNSPGIDEIDNFASKTEYRLMVDGICEQLQDCFKPLLDQMREQIVQQIKSGMASPFPPGEPLPDSEINRDLAGTYNPGCDHDILCAQVIGVNNYLIDAVTDALQIMAAATGELDLASVVAEITGIDELSIDALVDYARLLRDGIALNFAAQITTPYKDEIRCALFCRCEPDCKITLEDIFYVFRKRVTAYFDTPGATFATIQDVLTYLVQQELDGTIVADALIFLCIGTGKLGASFLGDIGTKPLEVILAMAADNPENDCDLDCNDCPLVAQNVGLFSLCGSGEISSVEFEDGVSFEVEAYETVDTGISSYIIALKLPEGNWSVTLDSITGTITPPVDTNETAYAWNDPVTGFQNVLWNSPAGPDDFGTHDTNTGTFNLWCSTQDWHAYLANNGPFSANFTVTAL